jgi:hypothetical protein
MLKHPDSSSLARKHVLATRAWVNRRSPFEPEARPWRELSAGKLGVSFREQVVLGRAIATSRDGAQHRQRQC